MLANGATLGYKEQSSSGTTYTDLPGLKEIPDIGTEPEKVDNTTLKDKHKKNEAGIGELPDMVYKFKYENTSATSPYRVLRKAQEEDKTLSFKETLSDGTSTEYDAKIGVKRTGGGVNGVIEFEVTMYVQSDITITDPA
jgi:hypothetical protein